MAKATRAATVKGVFLTPGVSKNKRLYTSEMIADAVSRGMTRIDEGKNPLSMFVSHQEAGNDATLLKVGKVTKLWQDPESGTGYYEADIAATTAGKDIATLVAGDFAGQCSIRGNFMGEMSLQDVDGMKAITAEGLELEGIDFTDRPGVTGAAVTDFALALESDEGIESLRSVDERVEKVDITLESNSDAVLEEFRSRLTQIIESASDEVNAMLGKPSNKTITEVESIKAKILAAGQKISLDLTAEWDSLYENAITHLTETREAWASMQVSGGQGYVSIDSGWIEDPKQVPAYAARIAAAALVALYKLDPDRDGDIDVASGDGDESAETVKPTVEATKDSSDCASCGATPPENALYCPQCGSVINQAESTDPDTIKETVVADTDNKTADEGTKTPVLNAADHEAIASLVLAGIGGKESAPATKPEETKPEETAPVTFTKEQFDAALAEHATKVRDETMAVAIEAFRQAGPARKGVTEGGVSIEEGDPSILDPKALAEMSSTEFQRFQGESWAKTPFFSRLFAKADQA